MESLAMSKAIALPMQHSHDNLDVIHLALGGIGFCLLAILVAIYYASHPRCVHLKRQANQLFGLERYDKLTDEPATESIAPLLQTPSEIERHQACAIIQGRIRGIIVRSILAGQGLPTLARALVQEDGARNRTGSGELERESNEYPSVKSLIAAIRRSQDEDDPRDQSVQVFGTQVKAVMRVRMRLLAAVVIQSWYRMIQCRLGYRKIFSSMNTAVITNLPSFGNARKQDNFEGISFVSSLSSWSSTWNRRQAPRPEDPSSYLNGLKSSSIRPALYKPTKAEKEALKQSIDTYASAYISIVQLQAWWRGSLIRLRIKNGLRGPNLNVFSDHTVSSPTLEGDARRKKEGSYGYESENTIRTSNMDVRRSKPPRAGTRRRRRHPNQYYVDLFQSTLERVTECHAICSTTINATASMDGNPLDRAKAFYQDNANYEDVMNNISNAANKIPDCAAIPSFCAEEAQKHIDAGHCDWMKRGDKLLEYTRLNAMQCIDQISALNMSTKRKGTSASEMACEDPSLYYIETLDVEPLSSANTNASTAQSINEFSSPSSDTPFSSAAPNTFSSPSSYTFQSVGSDETSRHSSSDDNRTGYHQRKNYAFCSAPAPTSLSESSNTDISDCDSYYSIDDGDVQTDEDNEDGSYGPFPIRLKNRRLIRRTVPRVHDSKPVPQRPVVSKVR